MRWADRTSAFRRSLHGEEAAAWTIEAELLAGVFDQLAVANRQRSTKGPKPKPLKRPKDKTQRTFGQGTAMDLDDLDALIGWESPRTRE